MGMYVYQRMSTLPDDLQERSRAPGIGRPVHKCPQCEGFIIDTDETEWELKSPEEKTNYFVISGWKSIVYSVALSLGARFLLKGLSFIDYMVLWAAGCVVFLWIFIFSNCKDIQESQARMADPQYRELLKTLGLLEK